ncbi:MAG: stage II sporulation protein M [archaeon]|nr:stage II sporulation protein M [archaeon]
MAQLKQIKNGIATSLNAIKNDRFMKIAFITIIFAFFLGYSMRFLDFTKSPFMGEIGVIYPIHQEVYPHYIGSMSSGLDRMEMSYDKISESPIDFLYVMRNNVISAVLLAGTGVLLAVPTIIFTFFVGLSAGASIAEVLEFASLLIAVKTIFMSATYLIAVALASSIGIEVGFAILKFLREKKMEISKIIYDKALLLMLLVVINIILQYVFLVM